MEKGNKKSAFTLAEVLVALTLLGIVAAIMVPSSIKHANERANKTRIRRALSTYQRAVESIVTVENRRSVQEIDAWASANNCQNVRRWFNIAGESSELAAFGVPNNPCIFRTNDGLWWNVTNLSETIVAFDRAVKRPAGDPERADIQNIANTARGDMYNSFVFVASFSPNGKAVRINDNNYEAGANGNVQKRDDIQKVLAYLDTSYSDVHRGRYNVNQVDGHCACQGEDCCNNSCRNQNICVEMDVTCRVTHGMTNCAGAFMPRGWGCHEITGGEGCNAKKYVYNDNGRRRVVQYDGDEITFIFDDNINESGWNNGVVKLQKNTDGTVTMKINSPYSGGAINEIVYKVDASGNIEAIKFRNYDRPDCTRTSCSWEANPFDSKYYDKVKFGGGFTHSDGSGCATGPAVMGSCGSGAGLSGSGSEDELLIQEISRLLGITTTDNKTK